MEGVTGTMAWLDHVPARCRRGVYGHADIDKLPFFSYRVGRVAEMEPAIMCKNNSGQQPARGSTCAVGDGRIARKGTQTRGAQCGCHTVNYLSRRDGGDPRVQHATCMNNLLWLSCPKRNATAPVSRDSRKPSACPSRSRS